MREKIESLTIHHRAPRTGFIFCWARNVAICISGLGCLITGLGFLGIILIGGRAIQIGVEGRITAQWDRHLQSALPILAPAAILILFGLIMLAGGLLANWLVTTPIYHAPAEAEKPDPSEEG